MRCRKALQVDVHRIDVGKQRFQYLQLHAAVGDDDVFHAARMHDGSAVTDELMADQRLIVGICHTDIASLLHLFGQIRQLQRRHFDMIGRLFPVHRDLMILTERAGQIAAEAAYGQDLASGIKLAQRLFLDGVQRQRRHLSIVHADDPALLIFPCTAAAQLPRRKPAVMHAYRTCPDLVQ